MTGTKSEEGEEEKGMEKGDGGEGTEEKIWIGHITGSQFGFFNLAEIGHKCFVLFFNLNIGSYPDAKTHLNY